MDYKGFSKEEILEIMEKVVSGYGFRYSFTYQSKEDVEQQAWIHALKGLENYDPEKSDLLRFLRVHVRNRLMNDKRSMFVRNDIPCKTCPAFVNGSCAAFSEPEEECKELGPWLKRNEARKNISQPIGMSEVDPTGERSMEVELPPEKATEWQEIWDLLEEDIPEDLKTIYQAWKSGYKPGCVRRYHLKEDDYKKLQSWIKEKVGYLFE
jgi:DNA-directed RNA polymerase specialized sigma24 family protein